jgi:hypothetical protein
VSVLYDSVKLNSTASYFIQYADLENQKLQLSLTAENDSAFITSDLLLVKALAVGSKEITLKCSDIYNSSATATLHFSVFANLTPVSSLLITKIAVLDPFEVEIDASGSFDRDADFVGQIIAYEYTINDSYVVVSPLPVIKYIFQSPGQKSVKLRVMDNDSTWSDLSVKYIVL